MPANLPPTYYKLKHQHEAAKTDEERLILLEEMLRVAPKHKGTEKVVSDLRRRIAKLKKTGSGTAGGKGNRKKGYSEHIPKHGAGQIVLLGPPNSGKSLILATFTKAKAEVSPTPYTTTAPTVGMLPYENIQFQLIDTPSLMPDFVPPAFIVLTRNVELLAIVVSLASDNLLDDLDMTRTVLQDAEVETQCIIVANQLDEAGAEDRLEILREFYAETLPIYPLSAKTNIGIEALSKAFYETLDIIRVYPKAPGQQVERDDPIVLPNGATVLDAALSLHKDFADFKFARIWGPQWHDGQSVSRNDIIHDGDVVEFRL